jgi:hypothetical protein
MLIMYKIRDSFPILSSIKIIIFSAADQHADSLHKTMHVNGNLVNLFIIHRKIKGCNKDIMIAETLSIIKSAVVVQDIQ